MQFNSNIQSSDSVLVKLITFHFFFWHYDDIEKSEPCIGDQAVWCIERDIIHHVNLWVDSVDQKVAKAWGVRAGTFVLDRPAESRDIVTI